MAAASDSSAGTGMARGVRRRAAVAALALLGAGCAQGPLLARAIRARGGPLPALARTVEATVTADYPGTWRARLVFAQPERFAWTIETVAEPDHYLFDGEAVRAFVGSALVSVDTDSAAPLRTYARFTAVMLLDALRRPEAAVQELAPAALPPGADAGLAVTFADTPGRFVLGFDDDARLVSISGPLDLPTVGPATVTAELSDFTRVRGWELPRRIRYLVGDRLLIDERAVALCPDPAGLDAAAFRDPAALPACP